MEISGCDFLRIALKCRSIYDVSFFRMERGKRNVTNLLIYAFLIVFALSMGYLIVYGRGGLVAVRKIEKDVGLLEEEIQQLEQENERLEWEVKSLRNNPEYIEGLAREMGYKKRGEIIFRFIRGRNSESEVNP